MFFGSFRERFVLSRFRTYSISSFRHSILRPLFFFSAAGGHLGRTKTREKIQRKFYWFKMSADIDEFVKTCDKCQRFSAKFRKPKAELHPIRVTRATPWYMVSRRFSRLSLSLSRVSSVRLFTLSFSLFLSQIGIDLVGPLPVTPAGNRYVCVVTDYFSKWAEAKAIPSKRTDGVAAFFYELICRFGCPRVVISDQGREFCSALLDSVFALTGADHRITSAYHPQTNGQTERFNGTLQKMVLKQVDENREAWEDYLDSSLFSYRTAVHSTTKYTPFFLMYGR